MLLSPWWLARRPAQSAQLPPGWHASKALTQQLHRLVDEMGQPIGPYRVWLQRTWVPGLAMSRALGDKLAHRYLPWPQLPSLPVRGKAGVAAVGRQPRCTAYMHRSGPWPELGMVPTFLCRC